MNNSEWLHQRLLERCGIPPEPARRHPPLPILREREWSDRFESLMRNRLIMGALRYGGVRDHRVDTKRYLDSIARRLEAYRADGNDEHLVDVANLCLVLFESGDHPLKHFRTGDGNEHC